MSWRSACELALLLGGRLAAGRRDPQHVELGAEALGRAPRAAHEPLRARVRLDEREQPLADGLRRSAASVLARADDLA